MKTVAPFKATHFGSAPQTNTLLASALFTSVLVLAGCQSLPMINSDTSTSNVSTASHTPIAAKTALANALQKQRRQSFSYHSNIEIKSDAKLTASSAINDTSLVSSDYVEDYCEDTHDQAYANLLARAEAQDNDILASRYNVQRATLKQSYLDCNQAYRAWSAQQDNDSYGDSNYVDSAYTADDSPDSSTDTVVEANKARSNETSGAAGATIIKTSSIKSKATDERASTNGANRNSVVSPYYQQLFDDYDTKTPVTDAKKAQLLEDYLLKPLSINAQGVYQPLAGRFTMLGSAQYQARNNQTSVNQPVYVDFKSGNIYLWADNFAIFNSELLDNRLGTRW